MKMSDGAIARAMFAKQLVADSAGLDERDPRDVLSSWDRDSFFGGKTVQLRIPLRDPVEVRRHLAIAEAAIHELRCKLDAQRNTDRQDLLMVVGVVRALNQKLNAYRSPRR